MAKNSSDDSPNPVAQWSQLLLSPSGIAIVLLVVSVAVGTLQFKLPRPIPESSFATHPTDLLRLDSRIWQDPAALMSPERLRDTGFLAQAAASTSNSWARLQKEFQSGSNAVLFVIGNSSLFPHGGEIRLRNRVAVLSAMRDSGLVKQGADETVFLLQRQWAEGESISNPTGDPFLVPAEMFLRETNTMSVRSDFTKVLVLWVGERELGKKPLAMLAGLLNRISAGTTNQQFVSAIQVGILGPRSSDGLARLMDEPDPPATLASTDGWAQVVKARIISSSARAPDGQYLTDSPAPPSEHGQPRQRLLEKLRKKHPGLELRQFGATDDLLCLLLADELRLRDVNLASDTILLLSEYDTLYGRSLPQTFRAAAAALQASSFSKPGSFLQDAYFNNQSNGYTPACAELLQKFEANLQTITTGPTKLATNIFRYSYLAGIDGSKSAADNKDDGRSDPVAALKKDMLDQPIGPEQLDYTRRLARRLASTHQGLSDVPFLPKHVKAIGLLGSDVFDKMLMLQALKRELPEAVYFTTELDARYNLRSQIPWTRNIVTASGFDLQPPPGSEPHGFAPFRDGYQTAAFQGCAWFLQSGAAPLVSDLGLYEYGRTTAHRLPAQPGSLGFLKSLHVSSKNLVLTGPTAFGLLIFVFFIVAVMAFASKAGKKWRLALLASALVWLLACHLLTEWFFYCGLEPREMGDGVGARASILLAGMGMGVALGGLICATQTGRRMSDTRGRPWFFAVWFFFIALLLIFWLNQSLPVRGTWDRVSLLRMFLWAAWAGSSAMCVVFLRFWWRFLGRLKKLEAALEPPRTAGETTAPAARQRWGRSLEDAQNLAADVEQSGGLSYFVMLSLLLLGLAGSNWLDAWVWSVWGCLFVGMQLLLIILLPLALTHQAACFKRQMAAQLVKYRLDNFNDLAAGKPLKDESVSKEVIENVETLLSSLNTGCFAPLSRQPVLGALATVIGGSSFIALLHQFLQRGG